MANGTGERQATTVTQAMADKAAGQPGTEVATRAKSQIEVFLDKMHADLEAQLVKHIPVDYFLRTCLTGLRQSDQLRAIATTPVGRTSIGVALLESARSGLVPFTEEAAIIPYGKTASFVPQYKGLIKQFYNSGQIEAVHARFIHAHDEWTLEYGTDGRFWHRPRLINDDGTPADRGEPVLAYCYLKIKGGGNTAVTTVTRAEAVRVRDEYSKSYARAEKNGKKNSTWHTEFNAMWLKTAIRQHASYAPKSPELTLALLAASRDDLYTDPAAAPPRPADVGMTAPESDGDVWDAVVVDDPNDQAPPPPDDPPPPPDNPRPWDRQRAMRHVQAMLRDAGLGGKTYDGARRAVARMLGRAETSDPPLDVASMAALDDDQLGRVESKLASITGQFKADGTPADQVQAHMLRLAEAAAPAGQEAGQ